MGIDTRNGREPRRRLRSLLALVSLVALLGIVGGIRLRLLEMPLERDEGEYGYAGQVILAGESIYREAYPIALKFPGTSVAYAGILAVFGETAAGLRGRADRGRGLGARDLVAQPGSDLSIFDWFSRYQQEHLEMVGLVTISPSGETRYHWDVAGRPPADSSENRVAVFRNKRGGGTE